MAGNILASIGKAKLKVFGFNPQAMHTSSEARVPGNPTFKGMDYQITGLGEKTTYIDCVTHPQIMGGLDSFAWIKKHHEQQDIINYIRLGSNFFGQNLGSYTIRSLDYDEDKIHPFDGVARKIECGIELLYLGDETLPTSNDQRFFGARI